MSRHDQLLTNLGLLPAIQPTPSVVAYRIVGAAGRVLGESNSPAHAERLSDGLRALGTFCTVQGGN